MLGRTTGCAAALVLALATAPAALAAPFAYIPNASSNTVSVIDTATNLVTATVTVGNRPLGVAVAPNGKTVYVTNTGAGSVSVIDVATNTVTSTIQVGSIAPGEIAVSPDSSHVYVSSTAGGGSVSVIDATSHNTTTISGVGASPSGIAVSPDGTKLYVAHSCVTCSAPSTVSVVTIATGAVASVPVGKNAIGLAIAPDGKHVYAANREDNTVSVIDTANNTVTATVTVGHAPIWLVVSPDSKTVYVSNEHMNAGAYGVSVVDAATNTVKSTVPTAPAMTPQGIDVTPDGTRVYVANLDTANVTVIGAGSGGLAALASVAVGTRPSAFGRFITPVGSTGPTPTLPGGGIVVSPHDFPYKVTFFTECTSSFAGICLRREVVRTCVGGNCFDVPSRTPGPICTRCLVGLGAAGGAIVSAAVGGTLVYRRRRPDGT